MVDPTLFTSIVQGGAFALLVFLVLWVLLRAHPASREDWNKREAAQEKKDVAFMALVETAIKTFGESTQKLAAENRQLVEMLATKHGIAVDRLMEESSKQEDKRATECREERQEWMTVVTKLPSQIQKVVAEVLEEGIEHGRREASGANGQRT